MPDEKEKNYRLNYKDVIQETIDKASKRQQYLNSLLYSSDEDDKKLIGRTGIGRIIIDTTGLKVIKPRFVNVKTSNLFNLVPLITLVITLSVSTAVLPEPAPADTIILVPEVFIASN